MTKYITLALITAVTLFSVGCKDSNPTADTLQREATQQSMQEAQRQVGMPAITNYQERKLVKWIFELRDRADLVTYAYIIDLNGNKHFLGKCIGYGIPYSVQFTNPQKIVEGDKALGYDLSGVVNYPMVLPQPDPNGLFMPEGLSATWLIMVDPNNPKGDPKPVYVEQEILVSPFKLH